MLASRGGPIMVLLGEIVLTLGCSKHGVQMIIVEEACSAAVCSSKRLGIETVCDGVPDERPEAETQSVLGAQPEQSPISLSSSKSGWGPPKCTGQQPACDGFIL